MADFEHLEQKVEADRAALAHSFDALSDTLSAERIAHDVSETITAYGGELGSQAMAAAKENPAAFALVGAGIALLLSGSGRRQSMRPTPAPVPEDAMHGFDTRVANADAEIRSEMSGTTMSPTALKLRANLDRGLNKLPPAARKRVLTARKAALDAQERLEKEAAKAATRAKRIHNDQPMITGAIAFGIGAIAAALLPSTRQEDTLMGAKRDALMADAQRVLSDEMAKLRDTAANAIDDVAGRTAAE